MLHFIVCLAVGLRNVRYMNIGKPNGKVTQFLVQICLRQVLLQTMLVFRQLGSPNTELTETARLQGVLFTCKSLWHFLRAPSLYLHLGLRASFNGWHWEDFYQSILDFSILVCILASAPWCPKAIDNNNSTLILISR